MTTRSTRCTRSDRDGLDAFASWTRSRTLLSHLYNLRAAPCLFDELLPLVPPAPLVDRHAAPAEEQEDRQVANREGLRLEDGLEEGNVDEGELDEERDRDGEEEHLIRGPGEEGDVEAAVLQGGGEVEEHERGERLLAGEVKIFEVSCVLAGILALACTRPRRTMV